MSKIFLRLLFWIDIHLTWLLIGSYLFTIDYVAMCVATIAGECFSYQIDKLSFIIIDIKIKNYKELYVLEE